MEIKENAGSLKEMICFMLLIASKREKPRRRSEFSTRQVADLMVITWLIRTRFNSKLDTSKYKIKLKP